MKTHGERHTKLYGVWNTMKQRCNNPNTIMFYRYGGRGIKVCDEWENSYESFSKFAKENGYAEGMSIERIDNNKGYSPKNCTFIPISEQSKNRDFCKLDEKDHDVIIGRYKKGHEQRRIANDYGVHYSRISQILLENNIETRSNASALRKLSDETINRMITIRNNTGKSFRKIGELFDVSGETVRQNIKRIQNV